MINRYKNPGTKSVLVRAIRVAISMSALALTGNVHSATLTVDTANDGVVSGDGFCSLREAIANANSHSQATSTDCPPGDGNDLIVFAPSVTSISLTGAELVLSGGAITIDGRTSPVTITANNPSRVFHVGSSTSATLNHLVVQGGYNSCIYSDGGALTLNSSTVTYCGRTGNGGGIASFGTVTLNNAAFTHNSVEGPNSAGGAVWASSDVTVTDSMLENNAAPYDPAIYAGGALTVTRSTVSGNTADCNADAGTPTRVSGGAIYANGTLTVTDSTFSGNGRPNAGAPSACHGGAVLFHSSATISDSLFVNNSAAAGQGGAISNLGGHLNVVNSTFYGNYAGQGGALYIDPALGDATLTNVTITADAAVPVGAALAGGNVTLISTIVAGASNQNCSGTLSTARPTSTMARVADSVQGRCRIPTRYWARWPSTEGRHRRRCRSPAAQPSMPVRLAAMVSQLINAG